MLSHTGTAECLYIVSIYAILILNGISKEIMYVFSLTVYLWSSYLKINSFRNTIEKIVKLQKNDNLISKPSVLQQWGDDLFNNSFKALSYCWFLSRGTMCMKMYDTVKGFSYSNSYLDSGEDLEWKTLDTLSSLQILTCNTLTIVFWK